MSMLFICQTAHGASFEVFKPDALEGTRGVLAEYREVLSSNEANDVQNMEVISASFVEIRGQIHTLSLEMLDQLEQALEGSPSSLPDQNSVIVSIIGLQVQTTA